MKVDLNTSNLEGLYSSYVWDKKRAQNSQADLLAALNDFKNNLQKEMDAKRTLLQDGTTHLKVSWSMYVSVTVKNGRIQFVEPLNLEDINDVLVDVPTEGGDDV